MGASMDFVTRAVFEVGGNIAGQMARFGMRAQKLGDQLTAVSTHSIAQLGTTAKWAGLLLGGMFARSLISGGMQFNILIEEIRNSVATTLTLYNHLPAGISASATAAEKLAARLDLAREISAELVMIAAQSPGEVRDVEKTFASILPSGIQAANHDMDKMLDLTRQVMLFGATIGNRFELAGRQIGYMLQGAARSSSVTFRQLAGPIQEAAKEMGGPFNKAVGEAALGSMEFTKGFNRGLDKVQRLELVMAAMSKLDPATIGKMFAENWEGATAAVKSSWDYLRGEFTKPLFSGLKKELVRAVSSGPLRFGSDSFKNLKTMMGSIGEAVWVPVVNLIGKAFDKLQYVADNWETVSQKIAEAFSIGMRAAKIMAGVAIMKTVGGAAMGGALQGYGMLVNAGRTLATVSAAGAVSLGLIGGALLAFGGVLVAGAGIVAAFVDDWKGLLDSVRSGAVSLGPVWDAIDTLWAKLVAVGQVFIGTSSAGERANIFVALVADGFHLLTGVMGMMLDITTAVVVAWNVLTASMNLFALGAVGIIHFLLSSVSEGIKKIPGMGGGIAGLDEWVSGLDSTMDRLSSSINEDKADARKWLDASKKFEETVASNNIVSLKFKEALTKAGGGHEGGPGKQDKGGKNINIHQITIHQNLRDLDPDRVAGAFVQKLTEVASKPTQSFMLEDYGV